MYGHDPNGYGQGVVGESYGGYGIAGAGSIGVVAEAFIPESSSIGILARAARQGRAGVFIGNVQIAGNLEHRGHIRGAVEHADGSRRQLYGLLSPEGWIEDFGRAQIAQGRTWVALDADFASVIQAEHYHVFLTPEGDSAGLYVSDRGPDGFEVREQGGGTSDLAFSYRVVAKPRKLEAKRFEEVEEIQELAEPTLSTATPTPPDLPPVYEVPVLQEAEAPPS